MRLRRALALLASIGIALPLSGTPTSPAFADSTCPIASAPSSGSGTTADPYQLGTAAELQWLRDSGSKSAHYALTANISMAGCTWTSGISAFSGSFDGQGFTIDGLRISSGDRSIGFFSATGRTAVIEDVGLTNMAVVSTFNPVRNTNLTDPGYVGGLVGSAEGIVRSTFVTGTITARYTGSIGSVAVMYVGGVAGVLANSSITDSWFSGVASGGGYTGGLVGRLFASTAQGSSTTGSTSGVYAGGLIGRSESTNTRAQTIESFSSMTVDGDRAGGLVGQLTGNVLRSQSSGAIRGVLRAGGIVAEAAGTVNIFDAIARGDVSVTASSWTCTAGGVVGFATSSNPTLQIARSFALGTVSHSTGYDCGNSTYIGPLIPSLIPLGKIVQASFYLNEVPGGNNTAGTQVTTPQLRDLTTYTSAAPAWQNTSADRFPIATVTNCSQVSDTHFSLCPGNDPYLSALGFLTPPDAPTGASGVGIDGGVELSWSAPGSDGGSPIVGYTIEMSTDGTNWSTAVANTGMLATTANVTGLTDGTTYIWRVSALNASGTSQPSAASTGVVAGALPSAPRDVTVSGVRSTEVDLTWDPPAVLGASEIQDYRVEFSIGDSSSWVTFADTGDDTTSITMTGLTTGGIYRFRVSAKNSLGWSPASDPTPEQYVGDVPEAPLNPRVSGWSRTGVQLSWQAPDPGSSPITGYQIEYSSDSGTEWTTFPTTYAASDTEGSVSGLTENREYQLRVLALNAAGPSSPSSIVTQVIGLLPSNPRNVVATVVSQETGSVRVSWDAPEDVGSSPVSTYRIDMSTDSGATWSTRVADWPSSSGTSLGLANLTGGRTYLFRVYATNLSGTSGAFGQSDAVTLGIVTVAPARPVTNPGDRSIEVTWQAPSATNTFPITGYTLQRSSNGGLNWSTVAANTASTSTTYTDTSLVNGAGYIYRVAAINDAGRSSFSTASVSVTPSGPSDFVSTWTITNAGETITLPLATGAGTSYDFTVAWGDGNFDTVSAADLPVQHTYASAGTYEVVISGTMVGWSFAQVPTSAAAITDVSQWGSFRPANGITGVFRGASNLDVTATDAPDLSRITALDDFFRDATSLTSPDLSRWDTSTALSMDSMFSGASSFNADISSWDTSAVVDMDNLLRDAVAFEQDLGDLDVTSVGSASGFLSGVQLDPGNYQALLVGWSQQSVRSSVQFSGGSSTWQVGGPSGAARALLTDTHRWSITDGGGTPGAPVITTTTPSSGQIALAWTAPSNDGGSPITDYQYSVDDGAWTSFGSLSTSGTITDLTDGTDYSLRVRAINSVGAGVASASVIEAPGSTAPAAPSSLSVTRGDRELTIDFVVTFDGGSPITEVEYSLDGGNWTSAGLPSTSVTITGLTNGTEYSIRLRVWNGSAWSAASESVTGTAATTPGQPAIIVTTGNGSLTVSANGSQDTGGLPITRYEYRLDSGTWVSVPSLPFTVSNLAPRLYVLDLRAVSAAGVSPIVTENVTVNVDAPGEVIGLRLTPGNGQISASWQAAEGDVTDYEYSINSDPWTSLGSTATSTVFTDRTNGTLYSVQVRAVNQGVTGPESEVVQATPGVPGPVTELSVIAGEEKLTVEWTAPDPGASLISNYEYSLDFGSSWILTGTSNPRVEVVGLLGGVTVTVIVRAINAFGAGDIGSGVSATPLPLGGGADSGVPSAPEDFTITPLPTGAELTWTAPADAGDSPVTQFQIGYFPAENPARPTTITVNDGSARSYTVTGLTPGIEYQFLLSAVNDTGIGPATSANVTVGDVPGAPGNLTAEPGNQSVTLSWSTPSPGTSPIFDYEYTIDGGAEWLPLTTGGTSATVVDLTNGTDYRFQIRARNESGPGPASNSVVQRPGVPRAPGDLRTTIEQEEVELQWSAPDDYGLGLLSYEITVSEVNDDSIVMRTLVMSALTPRTGTYTTTSTDFTLTGLSPTGSYLISVRAINDYGSGQPATTSIGLQPGEPDEDWIGPAPVTQQFGAPSEATADRCAQSAPADLDWAGVPSGGWGVSWAQWINDGAGGMVCTRTLIYDRWQDRWVLAA